MGQLTQARIASFGITHTGNIRSHNEDAFLIADDAHLWAVADGMGGHEQGQVASRGIVEALATYRPAHLLGTSIRNIAALLQSVNTELIIRANKKPDTIIGSTLSLLLIKGLYCVSVWAGDSRIYRYRNGTLKQITRDHSEAEILLEAGVEPEEIAAVPYAESITRAVGVDDILQLETRILEIQADDIFLICSDGLYKELTDTEIAQIIGKGSMENVAQQLLATALERQGRDNITIVLIKVKFVKEQGALKLDEEKGLT